MISQENTFAECNIETLVSSVVFGFTPIHCANNAEVCKFLNRLSKGTLGIGFVDDDKRKPKYITEFTQTKLDLRFPNNVRLRTVKHPINNHYLVISTKSMDSVAFEACRSAGLNQEYKFFYERSKRISCENAEVRTYIHNSMQVNNSPLQQLRNFLFKLGDEKKKGKKVRRKLR